MYCQHCGKECKNLNSLKQHEIRCKENPDKAVQRRLGDKARQIEEQVERSKITTEFLNKTYGI